jgi:hypothetical protein
MSKMESRKINVEIAPANRRCMERYIEKYNDRPERTTPKIKYTDIINEALDMFFQSRKPT